MELGETSPNPEQLKLLSSNLNVSVDELLDNNVNNVLVEKISNTEKLAGIIIKILKFIGIAFVLFFIIDLIALILYASTGNLTNVESSTTTIYKIENSQYEIEFGIDKYFRCENCSDKMNKEIKELVDFNNIADGMKKIENYLNPIMELVSNKLQFIKQIIKMILPKN